MRVTILDPVTPKPYTFETLETEPMGGTEATALRVAALLSTKHKVEILQRGRETRLNCSGVQFSQISDEPNNPNIIITLRDATTYRETKNKHLNTKHYLWLHDVVSGDYRAHLIANLHDQKDVNIICVSEWHKTQVIDALRSAMPLNNIKFHVIYNPLADYCTKTPDTKYDPFKLVYFSSPHKGLDYVLTLFNYLRVDEPRYKLVVANPGYYDSAKELPEGVINLGAVPHKQIVEEVRTALCTFYPQIGFAETFGLVLAESNAVGTPVISHTIGAAVEVLGSDRRQLMNCRDWLNVISTVQKWTKGERPIVKSNKDFAGEAVLRKWERLLVG